MNMNKETSNKSCQLNDFLDLLKSTSSKNHDQIKIILTSSQFHEYVQHQVLNQIQQQIYKFLLSPFLFK